MHGSKTTYIKTVLYCTTCGGGNGQACTRGHARDTRAQATQSSGSTTHRIIVLAALKSSSALHAIIHSTCKLHPLRPIVTSEASHPRCLRRTSQYTTSHPSLDTALLTVRSAASWAAKCDSSGQSDSRSHEASRSTLHPKRSASTRSVVAGLQCNSARGLLCHPAACRTSLHTLRPLTA